MLKIDKIFCIDGSGSKNSKLARQKTPIYEFCVQDRTVNRHFLSDECSAYNFFLNQAHKAIASKDKILIAADLPIGVPTKPADVYEALPERRFLTLLDTLGQRCQDTDWRTELISGNTSERSPLKPFVSVARGDEIGEWAGKRKCDQISKGCSIYPVDNSAKQVGKAALQFWLETLLPLKKQLGEKLRVWPFQELGQASVVVAECYPRICQETLYGKVVSKRNPVKVVEALNGVRTSERADISVTSRVWMHAASSEDEFDMFSTAVVLGRWFTQQGDPFATPEEEDIRRIEGWMLGLPANAKVQPAQRKSRTSNVSTEYRCPILGCSHVFKGTRGGWDGHVGSLRGHPEWHPGETDKKKRRELFKFEYPEFFEPEKKQQHRDLGPRNLKFVNGNLFASKSQTITNAVNCVGVMGKGIALEFKKRFPDMYIDYLQKCDTKELSIGRPYVFKGAQLPWVLNFPTKNHWRSKSKAEDVEAGLDYLAIHASKWGIESLAMPALGCGLGGLTWEVVHDMLIKKLGHLDIEITIYRPGEPKKKATGR